jgi:FHS family Na+ dependent glucose MFS transporter 1
MNSRQTFITTTVYFMGFMVLGVVTGTHGPAIPRYAELTGVSLETISIVFSSISVGHLIGSLASTKIFDKYDGNRILFAALVLMAVCLFLSAVNEVLVILIFLSVGIGVSKGLLNVGCNTLLSWLHGESVASYMNALHFFFGLGAFLGPILVASSLSHSSGIAVGFGTLSIITMLVAIWSLTLSRVQPTKAPEKQRDSSSVSLKAILLFAFVFLYVGTEVSFGGWIFTYASEAVITSNQMTAYLTSSFWGSLTVGRLVLIPFMGQFRPQSILLISLCFSMLCVLAMLHSDSLPFFLIGTVGLGLGMASIFPSLIVLAQNQLSITGRVMGQLSIWASIGAMTIPWLVGQFIEKNSNVLPWFTLLALGFALLILLFMTTRKLSIEKIYLR